MYELALRRVSRCEARRDLSLLQMVISAVSPMVDTKGKAAAQFRKTEKALLDRIQS